MYTVSIINHKGGVGKTTTAINLAGCLARNGKNVLLVDLDPQANLSSGMGFFDDENDAMYKVLTSNQNITIYEKEENLSVAPCSIKLADAEIELSSKIAREQRLRKALEPVQDKFDICIIDCPPSLSLLTVNSLVASDSILIPLEAKYFSLSALDSITNIFIQVKENLNPELEILGLFFNAYNPRLVLSQDISEVVTKRFGNALLKTNIRTNVAISEASTPPNSTHVFEYAPKTNGAADFNSLGTEILNRIYGEE